MTRDETLMRIRIPAGLREMVEAAAESRHRSMNAEIVERLEISFDAGDSSDDAAGFKQLAHINAQSTLAALQAGQTMAQTVSILARRFIEGLPEQYQRHPDAVSLRSLADAFAHGRPAPDGVTPEPARAPRKVTAKT